MVTADPFVSDLLAERRLSPLTSLTLQKRLTLGATLLRMLESGLPGNRLAHEFDVPAATVYSRITRLRDLFGADLDDPTCRFELIIALRAALPRWLAEQP